MNNILDTVFVDLQGPVISAEWLNAVGHALGGSGATTSIAAAGQTLFTIPASAAGTVYINGIWQIPGDSFTRTNATTITFSEPVPVNAKVVVL